MWQRLLHTLGEVLLSLVFAGGLFMVLVELMCLKRYRCDDFKGIIFYIISLILTIIVWGFLIQAYKKNRNQFGTRKKIDIALGVITVALWAGYFLTLA